jgi:hypothetical protein
MVLLKNHFTFNSIALWDTKYNLAFKGELLWLQAKH